LKLELITLGNKPPGWVSEGVEEYRRRMPRECSVTVTALTMARRGKRVDVMKVKEQEAQKIMGASQPDAYRVVLDVRGRIWSTEELARKMNRWLADYPLVQFVVWGPDGLTDQVVDQADAVWSLSRLTFPHFLVPLMIVEQLYRAWTLTQGHPYHRN
jgi:23S rRNA (pseudouridine1915-N3)-methyltransferase